MMLGDTVQFNIQKREQPDLFIKDSDDIAMALLVENVETFFQVAGKCMVGVFAIAPALSSKSSTYLSQLMQALDTVELLRIIKETRADLTQILKAKIDRIKEKASTVSDRIDQFLTLGGVLITTLKIYFMFLGEGDLVREATAAYAANGILQNSKRSVENIGELQETDKISLKKREKKIATLIFLIAALGISVVGFILFFQQTVVLGVLIFIFEFIYISGKFWANLAQRKIESYENEHVISPLALQAQKNIILKV